MGQMRVLALGADQFIDYKTEDYTQTLSQIDYVLDTLGGAETEKQMSIMKRWPAGFPPCHAKRGICQTHEPTKMETIPLWSSWS